MEIAGALFRRSGRRRRSGAGGGRVRRAGRDLDGGDEVVVAPEPEERDVKHVRQEVEAARRRADGDLRLVPLDEDDLRPRAG